MNVISQDQGQMYKMNDGFDYINQLITYRGKQYPFCKIEELQGNNSTWHIISTEDLDFALYNDEVGYTSKNAQWIDKQITYFVHNKEDLFKPAEQILREIYG